MKRLLVVSSALLSVGACASRTAGEAKPAAKPAGEHLQLATVEQAGVATVIKLPAQLAAYQEVSVFPKVNGYVKAVLVDIGSRVSAGALLMVLEAPELEQATLQAKERYARAKVEFSLAKEHYQRLLDAAKTDGAISPLDLSAGKARMEADSSLANAEHEAWEMQETMETYLKVTAPFDGVITERNIHPGALVSAATKDKPMLELKQVDRLRLQVEIPEGIAATLRTNDTVSFYTSAFPGKRMVGRISRKAMNVSVQMRAERVEIDVPNGSGQLAPGMYADVVLHDRGSLNALAVPRSAVVTTGERRYVIVVHEGRTTIVEVTTGNQTADRVEVYGSLHAGEKVVSKATEDIKEGILVI